ncbi:uncharacterized protein A4U43_C07F5270 [Asparagus officinalis]|uniref:Cupin type-1 domain-containing protein n=1 Tax=Asparagus officinalis TaxID=4686 RepID=A0A5P1ECV7_ASPOF|nr:vicilin-like seed storage protein At2g28490 [Asparagus officinalis]ONK62551.1 uncharacterized protein A4U43_C07F5270 [Asparagus officinalis]
MKLAVILTALLLSSPAVTGYRERDEEGEGGGRRFVLERAEKVVKTDGGEVRVVRGHRWDGHPTPMHIGFISMEPNTLFVPQYIDANLILFIRKGDVKIGWIHKDDLVEKQLKTGDINRIPAGSTFYIVNTGKGQRLHIICSIDTTNDYYSWDWTAPPYQSFFLGGGIYPKSVLAGFDMTTLTTAFNVTTEEIGAITGSGEAAEEPHRLSPLLNSNLKESTEKRHPTIHDEEDSQPTTSWTFTNLLSSILGFGNNNQQSQTNKKTAGPVRAPDSYNLYDRDPSFKNPFGWSISIDERDYHPLKHSDIGVYLVNLTAGSMLAPHVNPRATEYGIVLGGTGTIQVVYPNGSSAMKAEVNEGDVFWIPRFFPFCQIASRGGPFEFFGFTTSAKNNHPQLLAGARSVMTASMVVAGVGGRRGVK